VSAPAVALHAATAAPADVAARRRSPIAVLCAEVSAGALHRFAAALHVDVSTTASTVSSR